MIGEILGDRYELIEIIGEGEWLLFINPKIKS